jgi:hypothetical protein
MPGIVIIDNQELTNLSKRKMCVYDTGCCPVMRILSRPEKTATTFPKGDWQNTSD